MRPLTMFDEDAPVGQDRFMDAADANVSGIRTKTFNKRPVTQNSILSLS